MKKVFVRLIMAASVIWPLTSWSIGRVGNGIVDPVIGFKITMPFGYIPESTLSDGSLKIRRPTFNSEFGVQDYLQFVYLSSAYPQLDHLDRASANDWKLGVGGEVIPQVDPCVDIHLYESNTLVYGTAQWGPGKGVTILGPLNSEKRLEILQALQDLKLDSGACEWK